EFALVESGPAVLELLARPALLVAHEVEHEHAPARSQHAGRLAQRALRLLGVVQRLREHDEVDLARAQRQALDLAARQLAVLPARLLRLRAYAREHRAAEVDADHALARVAEQERELAAADPEVGHAPPRQEADQRLRKPLPRAAW